MVMVAHPRSVSVLSLNVGLIAFTVLEIDHFVFWPETAYSRPLLGVWGIIPQMTKPFAYAT